MKPTIGRIVHYVAPGSADGTYPPAHRAAIITDAPKANEEIVDGTPVRVNLMVFNPTGAHWVTGCPYDEQAGPYSWHWPEREES